MVKYFIKTYPRQSVKAAINKVYGSTTDVSKQVTIQLMQSPKNPWNFNEPENSIWKFGLQGFFWASVLTRPAWAKSSWTAVLQAPLQLDGQTWLRTSVTGDSSRGVTPFWPNASLMSCSIVCWNNQKKKQSTKCVCVVVQNLSLVLRSSLKTQ